MSTATFYPSEPPATPFNNQYDAYELGDVTLSSEYSGANIDDIVYRYSAEYDRYDGLGGQFGSPGSISGMAGVGIAFGSGLPKSGVYSHDGIWDEDDMISDSTTLRPMSVSTAGTSSKRRQSSKIVSSMSVNGSIKSRGRSGTVGSVTQNHTKNSSTDTTTGKEVKEGKAGVWHWGRKSQLNTPILEASERLPASIAMPEEKKTIAPSLRKEKSTSRLRGKGRRGELMVSVKNEADGIGQSKGTRFVQCGSS